VQLIPVVDLLGGQVVHARRGDRANYRPVQSHLCDGAEPVTVVRALLGLHPFRCLYVADLDAIQRKGDHREVLAGIRSSFPFLELWVDSGLADGSAAASWRASGLGLPIVGSESLRDMAALRDIAGALSGSAWILSVDFRGDEFLGPAELLRRAEELWPQRLLAMNLARVGSLHGPDLDLIRRLVRIAPGREVYAAGGVRAVADLHAAAGVGAAGALVATALHDGRIGTAELATLEAAQEKSPSGRTGSC
jgi:phosphoribosylformimino-5-aminoimidazole carboxamide ribotide isomerase